MKKLLLLLVPLLASSIASAENTSFSSSMRILAPLKIKVVKRLDFQAALTGRNQDVVTAPTDYNAAVFTAQGVPNTEVIAKVNEWSIQIVKGNGWTYGDWITVANFSYGGDLSSSGSATFDKNGELNNIRVGGTAYVRTHNTQGSYVGTATLRLSYL